MDIEKVHEYRNTFEWREVTADQPPHSYPMVAFRCKCNGKPLNYFYSPAIRDKRAANAKWRPLGGIGW